MYLQTHGARKVRVNYVKENHKLAMKTPSDKEKKGGLELEDLFVKKVYQR